MELLLCLIFYLANLCTDGYYYETSAVTGENVEEAISNIAHRTLNHLESEQISKIIIEDSGSSEKSSSNNM